jgi:NTP pyrophosphatase (non-canonical NTP hydrolase)
MHVPLAGDVEAVAARTAQRAVAQRQRGAADRAAQRTQRPGQSAGRGGRFVSMLLSDYQSRSRATAVYPNQGDNLLYPTLGLCGEAGEVAEKIKKMVRDDDGILSDERRAALSKELGDVLWYVAQLATEADLDLDAIAEENIAKLLSRRERNVLSGSGDDR